MEAPVIVHINAPTPRTVKLLTELADELGSTRIKIIRNRNIIPGFTSLDDIWLSRSSLGEMADAIGEDRIAVRSAVHVVHCQLRRHSVEYLGHSQSLMEKSKCMFEPVVVQRDYDMYATRADEFVTVIRKPGVIDDLIATIYDPQNMYIARHYAPDLLRCIWKKLADYLENLALRQSILA